MNPKSEGKGESAVQRIQGQFRTLKDALETKLKSRIETGSPIIPYLAEYAAETLNRYQVGKDGKQHTKGGKAKTLKEQSLK